MAVHTIRKGLDLPITGAPNQQVEDGPTVSHVAVLGADFHGMKPRLIVREGDTVRRGEKLFEDRKNDGVFFTAPGGGVVKTIERGAKRAFVAMVIELSGEERSGAADADDAGESLHVPFEHHTSTDALSYEPSALRDLLIESGAWTGLRTRPFSKVPAVDSKPAAVFVTAMNTAPLAPDLDVVHAERREDFQRGLAALVRLVEGAPVHLCTAPGSSIDAGGVSGVQSQTFAGPHPAGNVGVHIHHVRPASRAQVVWHIGLQELCDWGHLLRTGRLAANRVVSLAGPAASNPRLIRTRPGAVIEPLVQGEYDGNHETRVIAGSVLTGRKADGGSGFIGRYHDQITLIREGREREFLGWMGPGFGRFSVVRAFAQMFLPAKKHDFTTTTHGSHRAMVPIGSYEKVLPMDILPTFLLRALHSGDLEEAEKLGALELDEEDLALCTFVCPGKTNWGPLLRTRLTEIEKEG